MTRIRIAATGLALLLLVLAGCAAPEQPRRQAGTPTGTACAPGSSPPDAEQTPTTIDVIEQAYFCILENYYGGDTLDHRSLLLAGFVALTQELDRSGRDVPEATMPALTDDRKADWTAFEAGYRKITAKVPDLRDELAIVTLEAMVAALDDNHASWAHDAPPRPPNYYDGDGYGLGLEVNVDGGQVDAGIAVPPLFVTTVEGGAARAGLRPGDIIESINGSAPFIDGEATPAIAALDPNYPEARPVRLEVLRETTGRRWTVSLEPGLYRQDLDTLQRVQSKLLDGGIAYVRMLGFAPDSAKRVLDAISRLRAGHKLTGVVLDLRGNGGGSPAEATRLLSAFVHDEVVHYLCTVDDKCEPMRTDDTVDLVELPLVVLTDRRCASACEQFSSAVKDLHLGRLVGTRTAGLVSGPAKPYQLDNNTTLAFPTRHSLGADREVIDQIGVAPNHYVPLTPKDAATGHDPALAKALTLLLE